MHTQIFRVSFRFRSHEEELYEVEGEAIARYDYTDDWTRTTDPIEIQSVSLTSASVDGLPLTPQQLSIFEATYADDYESDLWWIAKQSIDSALS